MSWQPLVNKRCACCRRFVAAVAIAATTAARLQGMSTGSQSVDFCDDWRFAKGEHLAAQAVDFDDQSWAAVRVPHDWAISGPFDPTENGRAGKLPWRGIGWYRKSFTLD